jgi:hypothetical protein
VARTDGRVAAREERRRVEEDEVRRFIVRLAGAAKERPVSGRARFRAGEMVSVRRVLTLLYVR